MYFNAAQGSSQDMNYNFKLTCLPFTLTIPLAPPFTHTHLLIQTPCKSNPHVSRPHNARSVLWLLEVAYSEDPTKVVNEYVHEHKAKLRWVRLHRKNIAQFKLHC